MAAAVASGNGASEAVTMSPGPNVVNIYSTGIGASTTARLQTSVDSFASNICEHSDPQDSAAKAQLDVDDLDASGSSYSRSFIMYGPGQARVYVENYGSSNPITIDVRPSSVR